MSLDKIITPEINESDFQDSLAEAREKHNGVHIDTATARGFIKNLVLRNRASQRNGGDDYFRTNMLAAANECQIGGKAGRPYFTLAGFYNNKRKAAAAAYGDKEKEYAEILRQEREAENLLEMRRLELVGEYGEEEAERILRGLDKTN